MYIYNRKGTSETVEIEWNRFAWQKNIDKIGDFIKKKSIQNV